MKIVLDKNLQLTRADHPGDLRKGVEPNIKVEFDENAVVTHTPADLFKKYGFDVIEAERPEDVGTADRQYHDLRDRLLSDEELKKQVDQKFLMALENYRADFDRLLLQKVTYELEPGENIDAVIKQLENLDSNALFRAYSVDRENNSITTYATREGIWYVDGEFMPKSAELRSSDGRIRTDRALRSVREPTKKVDVSRINYPLFEETKALIENDVIPHSFATREQPDGSYRDDTPTVYVTKMHFKEDLSDEDIKQREASVAAAQSIKKETTHVGKRQATKEQAQDSIEDNKKEIHTKHEPVEVVKEKEVAAEVKETREDVLQSYVDKLFKDLEERQRQEREELKQKATAAMGQERIKAKQTFVTSLANGMTVTEAIDNLRAAKHNDILVQATLEEVKADMIASAKKDEIIAEKSKELEKTTKELESIAKKLETESKANKTNHENYIKELNKRKEAEVAIGKLKTLTEKLNTEYKKSKAEVIELKEDIAQRDHEIREQNEELEKQFEEIQNLSGQLKETEATLQKKEVAAAKMEERIKQLELSLNDIKSKAVNLEALVEQKDEEIQSKDKLIAQRDHEIVTVLQKLQEKEERIKQLEEKTESANKKLQGYEVKLAKMEARLEAVEEFNDKLEMMNKNFSERIEILSRENRQIEKEIHEKKEASLGDKIKQLKQGRDTEKKHNDDLFNEE